MAINNYLLLVISYSVVMVHSIDFIPDRLCGMLYTNGNIEPFKMKDFDQSVNFKRDYRASITGWTNTISIRIQRGCQMFLCEETYFSGTCHGFTENVSLANSFISQAKSANCTCSRVCKCEDVVLEKSEYGRAYLKGGCNACDSEYVSLRHGFMNRFDPDSILSVEAIKIQHGCNLTLYSNTQYRGNITVITSTITENFRGNMRSYNFECGNWENFSTEKHLTTRQPVDISLVDLPDSPETLLQMASVGHPGVFAALNSLEGGRSWKNAYILMIGDYAPSLVTGLDGCFSVGYNNIRECRIRVKLEHLGISSSDLRIIYYDIGFNDFHAFNTTEKDFRLMASLENFLSNHEELKCSIPNAVIIYRRPYAYTNNITYMNQMFENRLIKVANPTCSKLVDKNYSNVIFLLFNYPSQSNQNEQIESLEKVINEKWKFPKPLTILLKSESCKRWVNGFCKGHNAEYFPMNIRDNLLRICKKAGDTLGYEIIKQAYNQDSSNITVTTTDIFPANHIKVKMYRDTDGKISSTSRPTSLDIRGSARNEIIKKARIQALENRLTEQGKILKNRFAEQEITLENLLVERQTVLENRLAEQQRILENRFSEQERILRNHLVEKEASLENRLVDQERNQNATAERIKTEIWEKIKFDLNKLFE